MWLHLVFALVQVIHWLQLLKIKELKQWQLQPHGFMTKKQSNSSMAVKKVLLKKERQHKNLEISFYRTGQIDYIKTISTTDETAAMFGPYDYYLNPDRGAVKEWSSDQFALMTWEAWLTYNPRPSAKNLSAPTLMIHSDGAVLPDYTKVYFDEISTSDKKLIWVDTDILPSPFHQFNFYDQEEEVSLVVNETSNWFNKVL